MVLVTTDSGQLIGSKIDEVLRFTGVPYARAERFRPPRRLAPWTGVFDATGPGRKAFQAPQAAPGTAPAELERFFLGADPDQREVEQMSEDCHVLSILTPAADDGRRPVLVYVHGGGFDSGTALPASWGTRLAHENDVVVVGINHRLNVFGFLHLEGVDPAFAGCSNLGLQDIVIGLRWLRDNIAAFGGNPDNVTVFGESGGGMKISTLLAMPSAQGLLHKAVVQSGPMLDTLSAEAATAATQTFLGALDARPEDLLSMPTEQLLAAWLEHRTQVAPVVDGTVLPRAPFTPDAPETAAVVPLLIGYTLDELTLLGALLDPETLAASIPVTDEMRAELEAAYAAEFPDADQSIRTIRMISDFAFGNGTRALADRKAKQPAPVYCYLTTYTPALLGGRFGAFHGMDVPMVLRTVGFDEDETFSKTVASAWAAFARTGDPSTPEFTWRPYDPRARWTAELGDEPRMVADPHPRIRQAWGSEPVTAGISALISGH